jgi:glutamate-1-semialdehyde 2,1-aminomutase
MIGGVAADVRRRRQMTDQTAITAWPAHDPATRRWLPAHSTPVDPARVEALLAAEWERFVRQTPGSAEHNARASKTLPLGVTSSFQHWDPHPISIVSARGAHVTDVDGRRLLDMSMGFGAMMVGHLHPVVVDHVRHALDSVGTLFVTPSPTATEVAELFQDRFQLDMLRFTQSGTESVMYAIRVARAYTGRKAVIKVEGGYHGGYDAMQVSVKPALADIGPADAPIPAPSMSSRTTTSTSSVRFSRRTVGRSPRSSSSRSSRTSPSSSRTRDTSPVSAPRATSMASSSSSTR